MATFVDDFDLDIRLGTVEETESRMGETRYGPTEIKSYCTTGCGSDCWCPTTYHRN